MLLSSILFSKKPKEGTYRGVLLLDENKNIELPFNFDFNYEKNKAIVIVRNGDEKIRVDEISFLKDTIIIKMPVFDTEFRCKFGAKTWEGYWINNYRKEKRKIKFKAEYNNSRRFDFETQASDPTLEGRWAVKFSPGLKDSTRAIGLFHQVEQSNLVTGTFLTETGDYRYLEGVWQDKKLYLSCFDGSHAFLFLAELGSDQKLLGNFYSGSHHVEQWEGLKNEAAQLKNPEAITFVKDPDSIVDFSFPDTDGQMVNISEGRYANKPMIIQIMGTWCPNCLDESKYLCEVYNTYNTNGLEIVGLAFEKTNDFDKAKAQVLRLKTRLNLPYNILITQETGKEKASEKLSFLNKISAFPTTLYLNRKHQVVKVLTGFSGPATGNEFEIFKQKNVQTISRLLLE